MRTSYEYTRGVTYELQNGGRSLKSGEFAYILVTPAKDEEESLPALIHSIVNQSVRPVAWFVVDDASEDRTGQIIEEACSKHPWIYSLRLTAKHTYDLGEHVAHVHINGFEYALDYCERNNIDFGYIALSDADIVYPENYFEQCMSFLNGNGQFGIVSGRVLIKDKKGIIYEEGGLRLEGHPHGTARVWRKEAFEDTDGYVLTKSQDTVSSIMAELKGWKTKRLHDVVCYQTRETAGKTSLFRGYFNQGERAYYINENPLSIFNAIVDIMFISRQRNRITKSLGLLSGYSKSFLRREQKLNNDEVKRYMGSYKRVMKNYWLFLKLLTRKEKSP